MNFYDETFCLQEVNLDELHDESDDDEAEEARLEIVSLLAEVGLREKDYESRSYREMILESENGIQG